jgi:sugar/nucleoside kinase (ribokinase family)
LNEVSLHAITLVGNDRFGRFYARCISEKVSPEAALTISFTEAVNTGIAVVPVFRNGSRGCYVDLGANRVLTTDAVLECLSALPVDERSLARRGSAGSVLVHIAYPHLLPQLQGDNLVRLLLSMQRTFASDTEDLILSIDVNGATKCNSLETGLLWGAPGNPLCHLDIIHANYEEACALLGEEAITEGAAHLEPKSMGHVFDAEKTTISGHGMVVLECLKERILAGSSIDTSGDRLLVIAVTLGRHGAWVLGGPRRTLMPIKCTDGQFVNAPTITEGKRVNATGAGDAFAAGLCLGYLEAMRERSSQGSWPARSPDGWTKFFAEFALQSVSRKITAETNLHVDL